MTREEELFMKKIINGIEKIVIIVLNFLYLFKTKVTAAILNPSDLEGRIQYLYGPPVDEQKLANIVICLRIIIMPIIFVVGVLIYFNKSNAKLAKKIKVLIIAILIYTFVWIYCYRALYNLFEYFSMR